MPFKPEIRVDTTELIQEQQAKINELLATFKAGAAAVSVMDTAAMQRHFTKSFAADDKAHRRLLEQLLAEQEERRRATALPDGVTVFTSGKAVVVTYDAYRAQQQNGHEASGSSNAAEQAPRTRNGL